MIDFSSLIDQLDATFEGKKQSEKLMMYALPACLCLYISFWYAVPYVNDLVKKQNEHNEQIAAKIVEDKSYVSTFINDKNRIAQLTADNISLGMKLQDAKQKQLFIKEKMSEVSGVLYSQQAWTDFIDTLAQLAGTQKVSLNAISNKFLDANRSAFTKSMTIDLNATAEIGQLVRFIDAVEKSHLLVEVTNINMSGKKNIDMTMRISVWGVEL